MACLTSSLLVAFAALIALFEGPAQIICVLALLTIIASGNFKGFRPSLIEYGLLLWIFAGIPALIINTPTHGTEGILRPLISVAFLVGALGLAKADEKTIRRVAIAFAVACVANGLYGYIQVFIADPPLEMILARRLRSQHLINPENPDQLLQATGLFYSRLKLAHIGIVGLGLLGLMVTAQNKKRVWAIGGAVILAGAIFLTYRRAAPLALILSGVILAVVMGRLRTALSSLVAGAIVIGLFLLTDYGRERVMGLTENISERIQIYTHALEIARAHWLFGVGHGQYQQAILQVAPQMPRDLTTSPHNLILHVLAETGLVGLLGFCTACIGAIYRLILGIRADQQASDLMRTADRFTLLGLSCIIILGAVHSVLHHVPVSLLYWALLGFAATRMPAKIR